MIHSAIGTTFKPATLVELLQICAAEVGKDPAYFFLADGDNDEKIITYAELDRQARAIAAMLQEQSQPGDRVLLLYPSGLDFLAAYFGCLYAGAIAVTAYSPRLNRPSPRLQAIVADAGAKIALTTTQISSQRHRRFAQSPELATLTWLDSDTIPAGMENNWRDPQVTPDTVAFLQYTSGSTSTPKGVIITHGNLIHNVDLIYHGFQIESQVRGIFWLPSYHDMGLIGGILTPLYCGRASVIMPPASFLQKPVRWLKAISDYDGTISGAPNFAYQLCVDKITPEQRQGLDLSKWRIAFSGAEPVRAETMRQFAETFADCGFDASAFYPCYGLAEATLLAAGGNGPGRIITKSFDSASLRSNIVLPIGTQTAVSHPNAQEFVSCGHSLANQKIQIVNPDTNALCTHSQIGEIWIKGGSIAQGYWQQPQATQETFQAHILGKEDGPYLRTGDLGFKHEGHLFISGRRKDLIIIRGANHYPQDIEHTVANCHPALEPEMGAAFSVEAAGEEQLVVIHEVARRHRNPNMEEVVTAVRRAIAKQHQLQLHALVLIKPLSISRTSSGKIMRFACKEAYLDGTLKVVAEWKMGDDTAAASPPVQESKPTTPQATAAASLNITTIENWLIAKIAEQVKISQAQIDPTKPFVDYGLDSVQAVSLSGDLESWLGRALPPTLVWDYPSIAELSAYLAKSAPANGSQLMVQTPPEEAEGQRPLPTNNDPIAIIGLGCRFPGADSPAAFWQLLENGVDAIREVPSERWDVDQLYDPEVGPGKMNTRWGGFVERADEFDPQFFNITPREAARMDPQQRLLLEVTWEALEQAGQAPSKLAGSKTGVFVGISSFDYSNFQLSDYDALDIYVGTGNAHSIAANRLSYTFDLRGPSMAIDTACSSSLVAVHLACQSLKQGESNVAIAGGVNLLLTPEATIFFSQGRMMASDGHCKTFDAAADGYVRGEGCGVVILKRLSDAVRDGDSILATIKGSAINQDGRSNGLTAPNGPSQEAVIREALAQANTLPQQIDYVEAHGTGTPLGDPIELHSLSHVLDNGRRSDQPYFVGSVKTNIGHLEAAAGVAGLMKVVLALQNEKIPAHLNFNTLNPHIGLNGSPLQIPAQGADWARNGKPRLAGVSAFGFGGTNAHIIVGDWTQPEPTQKPEPQTDHVLVLSTKREEDLAQLATAYHDLLAANPTAPLADICYTASQGRSHFEHRLAVSANGVAQMQKRLKSVMNGRSPAGVHQGEIMSRQTPKIAFLFTSPGAQYPGMGRELYESQPVFRAAIDECAAILANIIDIPLLTLLFDNLDAEDHPVHNLAYTQPALFSLEYGLVKLWASWGIVPDLVMGHSMGEYVAALVAGVFSLEDGLRLITQRGRVMQAAPGNGMMVSVMASAERTTTILEDYQAQVNLAGISSPNNVVISGEATAVSQAISTLEAQAIDYQILPVSQAAHSPMMEPVLAPFQEILDQISFSKPQIPIVSTLLGQVIEPGSIPDTSYWLRHLREPVQMMAATHALVEQGATVFLEVGPHPNLLSMARRNVARDVKIAWLPSLRNKRPDSQVMLNSLAALYAVDAPIKWEIIYPAAQHRKLSLPTYPFARRRYWFESKSDGQPKIRKAQGQGQFNTARLETAVPIFESQITVTESTDLADLFKQVIDQIADVLFVDGSPIEQLDLLEDGPDGDGRIQLQTIVTLNEDEATFEIFRDADAGDGWVLWGYGRWQAGHTLRQHAPAPDTQAYEIKNLTHDQLTQLPEQERQSQLLGYLQNLVARVIGLDPDELGIHQPLNTLGLDSLMAIEVRRDVEKQMDISVPVVNLLQGPTLTGLAEQILGMLASPEARANPIPAISETGKPQPLSYNQQALWFLHEMLPETVSFNVSGAVRILGEMDVAAMQRAFQKLTNRHPALRTTFSMGQGTPTQTVQPHMEAAFQLIQAEKWDEAMLEKYLVREAYGRFNLETGPVIKMQLLKRSETEHVLLLAMDHIIVELWSISVIVQELVSLYESERIGTEVTLPPLEIEFTDYVHWETELLGGEEGERLKQYWQKQLGVRSGSDTLPVLDLPLDRPRSPEQTFTGDTASHVIGATLTHQLRALSLSEGATLYVTLLAAFQTLLHRYTGQEDLLVGSVLAGRDRPELAGLVGYMLNPVAMRADFSGDPDFASFLQQTRQTVLDAFDHQRYPLPMLANSLDFVRDPSRPPLFETMFIMQKAQVVNGISLSSFAPGMPNSRTMLGSLAVETMRLPDMPAQFDLTLMIAEMEDGLGISMHYNTDLFNPATIERMLQHFEAVLQGVADGRKRPLSSLSLLPAQEKERLLVDWNATQQPFEQSLCVHELITQQAQRTPEETAVSCQGTQLTYAELDAKSNQLAHLLQQRGVVAGQFVAVCLDRSVDMLTSLLAVMKTGAAYIPMDPAFPPERLALMWQDAQPMLLLTQTQHSNLLPNIAREQMLLLDQESTVNSQQLTVNSQQLSVNVTAPDDPIYVIYTSGSTGKPKGVQVSHRNVVNFLTAMRQEPGITATDKLLAVTTLSFDIATLELFLPLTVGAEVVIASSQTAADGVALMAQMQADGISIMQATPATWHLLLEAGWTGDEQLKILCGGEALPRGLANQLLARSAELWNMYGPTETTVWSTICPVEAGDDPISIGRPIANTQIYILDDAMQPVPIGVVGNLYIGGAGVAQGYLNQPQLTAERFITNPFINGQTMYYTGDRARYLPDGNILFLGRDDFQVKLRGFRIELGDIEAALVSIASASIVKQAVTIIREDSPGDKRLVSYVVHHEGQQSTPEELRHALRQKLPEYMIPAHFVTLPALPLTANDKINRKALPAPAQTRPELNASYVAPKTALEKQLAAICAEVLGLEKVGSHDNFFDLGGNSLLATRLIFKVREAIGVHVPLRYLFAEPTVAGLAQAVEATQQAGDDDAKQFTPPSLFEEMSVAELNAEVVLDEAIPTPNLPLANIKEPEHIFLTGATGFLGAFLLNELLTSTDAQIYCLVRAKDVGNGRLRLRKNLETYNLWQDDLASRITVEVGDLSKRLLGLSQQRFDQLANQIDTIYHNGAMVNFVYSYKVHKGPNVLGTQEVLRLAGQKQLKAVHFVSTLSVLHTGAHDDGSMYYETDVLDEIGSPFGGYAKSKWVAEKLIMEANRRGIPAAVYRPGMISGDSVTGTANEDDMMSSLLRVCMSIGVIPDLDVQIDIVPVNYVSGAVVQLSLNAHFEGQTFHLANPTRMAFHDLTAFFNEIGYKSTLVPFTEWRDGLINLAAQFGGGGWDSFLPLLEEAEAEQAFMPAFDCRNTIAGLADSKVVCAPVGAELMQKYVTNFETLGLLERPKD